MLEQRKLFGLIKNENETLRVLQCFLPSMYGNDYDKVVSAVNELCINDFNDMLI